MLFYYEQYIAYLKSKFSTIVHLLENKLSSKETSSDSNPFKRL